LPDDDDDGLDGPRNVGFIQTPDAADSTPKLVAAKAQDIILF